MERDEDIQCPLYYFFLFWKLFLCKIRLNRDIEALSIGSIEHKLAEFADVVLFYI